MYKLYTILFTLVFVQRALYAQDTKNPCELQNGPKSKSPIAYSLYFESKPHDATQCAMTVVNGRIVIDPAVSNPALSCPDMVAWKLFAESIRGEFWNKWAADQQTWPGCSTGSPGCLSTDHPPTAPKPLCVAGSDPKLCCDPANANNPGYDDKWNPAKFCPYFPGDHLLSGPQNAPIGLPPSKAHFGSFSRAAGFSEARLLAVDPSRTIRQTMSEIVFRNRPMWLYAFAHNLYNQEGLANVFANANQNLKAGLPYRDSDLPGHLTSIDFPVESVMIKSDWLNEKVALQMGLKDSPPHIKMEIRSPVTDNNGTILEKGTHWLVAMHISSKDIPNWVWATFEHVGNPGRCDYIGCNDSFGYDSTDPSIGVNQARNFTAPNIGCDNLPLASWIFKTEEPYSAERITARLAAILKGMGIGTGTGQGEPQTSDPAWLNYRLKGTQVDFTDPTGRATRLANSVTEAGFTNSSSCITCHARAGIAAKGSIPLPNGVFLNTLGDQGYAQSANGIPDPSWYNLTANPPSYRAVQSDFVWGVLAALCVDPNFNPDVCSTSPSAVHALTSPEALPRRARSIRDFTQK